LFERARIELAERPAVVADVLWCASMSRASAAADAALVAIAQMAASKDLQVMPVVECRHLVFFAVDISVGDGVASPDNTRCHRNRSTLPGKPVFASSASCVTNSISHQQA
jgi:hypothetical protein